MLVVGAIIFVISLIAMITIRDKKTFIASIVFLVVGAAIVYLDYHCPIIYVTDVTVSDHLDIENIEIEFNKPVKITVLKEKSLLSFIMSNNNDFYTIEVEICE